MILTTLDISAEKFRNHSGWEIKPEGACKADVCVPLPGGFDLVTTTQRLGMAVVHGQDASVWAVGPESLGGKALATAEAPDLVLADLEGREFQLSSLRGQKVVLVAWAPY